MTKPFPSPPQLDTHNRYPDCLGMELSALPLESDASPEGAIALILTLKLNEQWESLLGGKVKFGLKGGQLFLKLKEGEIPLKSESDILWQLTPLPETEEAASVTSLQVRRERTENSIAWALSGKPGATILKGRIDGLELTQLTIAQLPETIEASFAIAPEDISLTAAEGLWKHDISPNKHAILERTLARFLWQERLSPYLSLARWPDLPSQAHFPEEEPELQALEATIQTLSAATTDDFLELAAIAQLDPQQELAGGNFLGANLRGINLSGSNLARVNLRGADLSDADLSEANLQGAKLSGADLSGAYLGNADLSETELYRASLALANLGGANLSGANLREANLSSTNLNRVTVKGATFGSNPGIAEMAKLDLQQRGANFASLEAPG